MPFENLSAEVLADFADVSGLGREWFDPEAFSTFRRKGSGRRRRKWTAAERAEFRRLSQRRWWAANKDRVNALLRHKRATDPEWRARSNAWVRRYWSKPENRQRKRSRERSPQNRARVLASRRKRYAADPAYRAKRLRDASAWAKANRAKRKAYEAKWREKNRERINRLAREWKRKRRAKDNPKDRR